MLDRVLAGEPAERVLTNWARGHRFAGSKDRAAIRDIVFDCLRCLRSYGARGGGMTGRGVVLGALRTAGIEADGVFTGTGHAPAPLDEAERPGGRAPDALEAIDCPEWLAPRLKASLGAEFETTMLQLRSRAPVHLRVNLRKATREAAARHLASEGIATCPHPLSPTALEVTEGARRVQASGSYAKGLVELQDAASQSVVDSLPLREGAAVLDYCAGGGGKTLALAARIDARYNAYDLLPGRMADLPARARRAGIEVALLADPAVAGPYDLVMCDVPCSGSGAWRRSPEGKWRLTEQALLRLTEMQARILGDASRLVRPGGVLAYVTCSLLDDENGAQIDAFLDAHPGWREVYRRRLVPGEGGDGFFVAHLTSP